MAIDFSKNSFFYHFLYQYFSWQYSALTFLLCAQKPHINIIIQMYLHIYFISLFDMDNVQYIQYIAPPALLLKKANSHVWSLSGVELDAALRGKQFNLSVCVCKAHIKRINPYYSVYNLFPFSTKCNMCWRSVGIMVIASIKLLIFMNDILIFHIGNDPPLMLTNCSGLCW